MNKIIVFSILILCFNFTQEFDPQSKKITNSFFPDINVEINTPAFKKPKGFTNYNELIFFINDLQKKYPEIVSIKYIGQTQKGKAIPFVVLNKKSYDKKLKVFLQGGLHGDEMASSEGVLFLMEKLLNDSSYSYLLNKLEIAIIPVANIDGYEIQDRYAANGLDLNRDQTKLMIKESNFLKQTFSDFNPHVAIDFHEYRPFRKEFAQLSNYGITSFYDAMIMTSGNLNVPEKIRAYTKNKFVKNVEVTLNDLGISNREYLTSEKVLGDIHFNQGSNNSRSSATSFALANTISTLIEIRGVGLGRTSFKRRVFSTFSIGISYLKTAYENINEIDELLKNEYNTNDLAIVTCKKEKSIEPLKVIDLDTEKEITIDVTVFNASKSTAVLTRVKPFAYLVENNQQNIIDKLKILGLAVETLTTIKEIEVESYYVSEYNIDNVKDEGVYQQKVKTTINTEKKSFAEGTFIIYMNQENCGLAIETLEPEGHNGFVNFSVILTKKDEKLPIYRYLKNEKL